MTRILKFVSVLLLVVFASVTAAAQNGHDLLQKALRKERVEGDLKGAIELYQQITKDHPANRALAAQALLQMGKGYEKLGAADARGAYQKVISEFADQSKEVAEAKARLNTLDVQANVNAADRQLIIKKITPAKTDHWDHWVSSGDTSPSPDGRYFGYVNWSHGNLAVCDTHTGEVRDLTTEGTWAGPDQFTWGAVWSPDSRQVAYIWINGNEGDLRIVDRAGGIPRVVVPLDKGGSIAPFDWSKDGRFIVGLGPIKKWPEGAKKTLQIVRVEVATGTLTVVKELPVASDNVGISLSPDGKYIAHDTLPRRVDVANSPRSRIHIVSIDGSTDRPLIDHPAASYSPHWTPDGGHLIFRSDRSGEDALWSVPVKDGQATNQPKLVRNGFDGGELLGFADDGTLYYTARTPQMNVFVADVDFDAGTMQPPKLVSLRNDGKNRNARWSADGSQFGYVSVRSGAWPPGGALVFHDTATGKEREVKVAALNFFSQPFWSPDLSKLAGSARVPGRDNNSRALYLVDAKNGQRSMFLDKDSDSANFTTDGNYLIYRNHIWEGPNAGGELIERDLKSGTERVILHRKSGFGDSMRLSIDGTKLAFCEKPYSPKTEEKTHLLITSRANGESQTVWEIPRGEASVLDWLPDNRRVLVSVDDTAGAQQLHLIDTETKSDRLFSQPLRGNEKIRQLSVHPNGKRIALSRGGMSQEIWTMKNIVPEPKEPQNALGGHGSATRKNGQAVIQKFDADKFGKWAASPDSSVSPDGRYLSYVNWAFGNLALCDTKTGDVRDLTTEGTWEPPDQFAWRSVWSPDSQQIAYVWYKGDAIELRIVDRNGGKPRLLVPFEQSGGIHPWQWSNDGRFIVGVAPLKEWPKGAKKVFQIVRVDVASGAVTVVKELPDATDSVNVALSPDGKNIIYNFPAGQLHMVDTDGSNDRVLLDQPASAGQLVWMPEGKHVIFVSQRSGTEALWALPLKEREATGAPILIRDGFFHSLLWGSTADGTLCWLTTTPRANVFVADVDFAAGPIQPPRHVSLRFDGRSRHPHWSRDGRELTYVSRQFPGTKDATHVIHDIVSGKERDVRIPGLAYWSPPQWSADYRKLYCRAILEGGDSYLLYEVDAQSGQPSLINAGNSGAPNLTQDGNHLIYLKETPSGTNQVSEIIERDLRSRQERVIRRSSQRTALTKMNSMKCPLPLLSRDDAQLAYLEKSGTNTLLLIISRTDGTTKTAWEMPDWTATVLDWLPDNRHVLVSIENESGEDGQQTETQQLHVVDTETRNVRSFGPLLRGNDRIHQANIHPSGKRIALCRSGEIREVWTMKNFLADEKLVAK